VYIVFEHCEFKTSLRLVDLPGLVRKSDLPMKIAKEYIQPGNICILIIGKVDGDNGGWKSIAESMARCSQIIFVQNFTTSMRGVLDNHVSMLEEQMQMVTGEDTHITLHCVDYGFPKTEKNVKVRLWVDGDGQQDWEGIHVREGPRKVQEKMFLHEDMKTQQLKTCLEEAGFDTRQFVPGLHGVLAKLFEFQTQDLPASISTLERRVKEALDFEEEKIQDLRHEVKRLKNPPEFNALLFRTASIFQGFLEATQDPHMNDNVREESTAWTTEQELEACIAGVGAESEAACWYDEDTDTRIRSELKKQGNFQPDLALSGLSSWHRLLNEFIGALSFAPMPCIRKQRLTQAMHRMGEGTSGTVHILDTVTDLVVELEYADGRSPIRPLLAHLRERLLVLVRRDVSNVMLLVGQDGKQDGEGGLVSQFLRVVEQDTTEMQKQLLERIEKSLRMYIEGEVKRTIDGEQCLDKHSKPIMVSGTTRPKLREASGLRVRKDENTKHASKLPHWATPVKAYLLNGQVPMRNLQYAPGTDFEPRLTCSAPCEPFNFFSRLSHHVSDKTPSGPMWTDTSKEEINQNAGETINLCNAVNLDVYLNATREYEFPLASESAIENYDLAVFKLLFTSQVRVVEAWASQWQGMVQRLLDEPEALKFIEKELRQDLKDKGQLARFDILMEQVREGVQSIFKYLKGTSVDERLDSPMTTMGEVKKFRVPWPGFSIDDYEKKLDDLCKESELGFLSRKDQPMACQASWLRLCEEYELMGMQLSMPKVSEAELAATKPSTGISMTASPKERVDKLTQHRLMRLSQDSPSVFTDRMLCLVKRDVKAGLRRLRRDHVGSTEEVDDTVSKRLDDGQLKDLLQKEFTGFANSVVADAMQGLKQVYASLSPFDGTVLNGRRPLDDKRPLRMDHFELEPAGKRAERKDAQMVLEELREACCSPQKSFWSDVKLHVHRDQGFIKASTETTLRVYRNIVDKGIDRVEQIMRLPLEDAPYSSEDRTRDGGSEFAGGMQHQLLLTFFKIVHVDAIHYCRPRLVKMMAEIYKQEKLIRALQDNPELNYSTIYAPKIAEKEQELVQREHKLEQKRRVLSQSHEPSPEPSGDDEAPIAQWDDAEV